MDAETTEIEKRLRCDDSNTDVAHRVLNNFSPELPEALNEAATIYNTVSRTFCQAANDSA